MRATKTPTPQSYTRNLLVMSPVLAMAAWLIVMQPVSVTACVIASVLTLAAMAGIRWWTRRATTTPTPPVLLLAALAVATSVTYPGPARAMTDLEDAELGAAMAAMAMASAAGGFWGDMWTMGGWTSPYCQTRCDIAGGTMLAACAGVGMLDDVTGFTCVLIQQGATNTCKMMCNP